MEPVSLEQESDTAEIDVGIDWGDALEAESAGGQDGGAKNAGGDSSAADVGENEIDFGIEIVDVANITLEVSGEECDGGEREGEPAGEKKRAVDEGTEREFLFALVPSAHPNNPHPHTSTLSLPHPLPPSRPAQLTGRASWSVP